MKQSLTILAASLVLAGCNTKPFATKDTPEPEQSTQQSTEAATSTATQKPQEKDGQRPAPGAQAAGGEKKEVSGINGWSGYVQGKPADNSKFETLKMGMTDWQVIGLVGAPTDQSSYPTGKAFIPFYYGSGQFETMFFYKGMGRLLFSHANQYSRDRMLIGIEHDAAERGHP